MRSYKRKRRTNKPQSLVEKAGQLHVQGKSNRAIARSLGVKHDTVPAMLGESEIVRRHRAGLLSRVPTMLESFDLLIRPHPRLSAEELGRNIRWGLEHTGVAGDRETDHGDEDIIVELARLTAAERGDRLRAIQSERARIRLEIHRRTHNRGPQAGS